MRISKLRVSSYGTRVLTRFEVQHYMHYIETSFFEKLRYETIEISKLRINN